MKVQHLHSNSSDHLAIIVKPEGIIPKPHRPFKFEQMWLRDKGCSDTEKKLLAKAKMGVAKGGDQLLVKTLQKEISALLDKEIQMWQQRLRALFLKCGDRNTSYFHSKASQWFRRNRILSLKNN